VRNGLGMLKIVGGGRDIAGAVEGGLRRAWVSILVGYGYFQLRTAGNESKYISKGGGGVGRFLG
jgi:hypothetical protein